MNKKVILFLALATFFSLSFLVITFFHHARQTSEEKAILGNLAQLTSVADQYFLDNEKEWCSFDDLVGPDKYLKTIAVYRGENYRDIFPIRKSFAAISVTTESGRVITRPR